MPPRRRELPNSSPVPLPAGTLLEAVWKLGWSSQLVRFSRTGAERTCVREHRKRRKSHQMAGQAKFPNGLLTNERAQLVAVLIS